MGSGGHREEETSKEARKMKNTEIKDHKELNVSLRELWISREGSWSVIKANGNI